ncbi:thioredoxin family protein [Pedobacter sp. UC225_61]|uniref:thioredoxin family protein n=1 Tax=Pedobacter sp. UC225_61 TaxID=3374623 RepID=UPI0037B3F452
MKNIIWAICLFMITTSATAAEINFLDNPVWNTVLEKAKKENKVIFLDAYATWCGPCKMMDSETYKDQAVADYYNANFINVKYDMEKGEGLLLAQRFSVESYPNLLFINPDGTVLHRGTGFRKGPEFTDLGQNAQFLISKKSAMAMSNVQFVKFAEEATKFEDEDFDQMSEDYLAKQTDILGNADLIDLIMNYANSLPDQKSLAYIANNKAKILQTGNYTEDDFNERLISLTLGYSLSEHEQLDDEALDFEVIKTLLEKYVPEKAFFVYHYFKSQYALDNKETDEAISEFDAILTNTPTKVTFDQVCNAMMNIGPGLLSEGKLETTLKKFEDIKLTEKDADKAYMKDFVKAIIYIKVKDFEKFKGVANTMITSTGTPEKVKEDLKAALERIK